MENRSHAIAAGSFVLVLLALLIGLAVWLTRDTGQYQQYEISSQEVVTGLQVQAGVRYKGVTVGRVTAIALDPKSFQGLVTIEVDSRVKFPSDTSAKILTSGLLGDQYIGLEPGGADKDLAGGDQIKMTQSAVVLENLIGQFLYNKAAEGGDKK